MKYERFKDFWNSTIMNWYNFANILNSNTLLQVNTLCSIKNEENDILKAYHVYEKIKEIIKDSYFKDPEISCYLNRYKRAAVLTYTVIKVDPISYSSPKKQPWIDPNLLKQRLAFYVALCAIMQDFEIINTELSTDQIFRFDKLSSSYVNVNSIEDTFQESVYKDLLFSEIYNNFNVLTMANLYGLLTERALLLGTIKPKSICERD